MAHGTPDYGGAGPKSTTYFLQDMAELAVRLGSPVNLDRRGEVIALIAFGSGWQGWIGTGSGVGFAGYISSKEPLHGNCHAVLKTGNVLNDNYAMGSQIFYPAPGPAGVEGSFIPVANLLNFDVLAQAFTGAVTTLFGARYLHTTGKLQVNDAVAGWVEIGSPGVQFQAMSCYSYLKMVVDLTTGYYVRVIFNGQGFTPTAYQGISSATAVRKSLWTGVAVYTGAAASIEVPVGHVIVTQNEPV